MAGNGSGWTADHIRNATIVVLTVAVGVTNGVQGWWQENQRQAAVKETKATLSADLRAMESAYAKVLAPLAEQVDELQEDKEQLIAKLHHMEQRHRLAERRLRHLLQQGATLTPELEAPLVEPE